MHQGNPLQRCTPTESKLKITRGGDSKLLFRTLGGGKKSPLKYENTLGLYKFNVQLTPIWYTTPQAKN